MRSILLTPGPEVKMMKLMVMSLGNSYEILFDGVKKNSQKWRKVFIFLKICTVDYKILFSKPNKYAIICLTQS